MPDGAATAAGGGKASCPNGVAIAFLGAASGPRAEPGVSIYRGAKLAVDQHNRANAQCHVTLRRFDTEGDPATAATLLTQLVDDPSVLAVVGPAAESSTTGELLEKAGIVHLVPSATTDDAPANNGRTFYRAVGTDDTQGPAAARLAKNLGALKVFVVQDDTAYGRSVGTPASETLGALLVGSASVHVGTTDFSGTVAEVMASKPDVVVYSGAVAEAARLDRQLVAHGFQGAIIAPDRSMDGRFSALAGSAAKNAYFTCLCMPSALYPDFAKAFSAAYKGAAPRAYSIESYDSAIVLLQGIDQGNDDRKALHRFVAQYSAQGYSRWLKWDASGELAEAPVYGYRVDGRTIAPVGALD